MINRRQAGGAPFQLTSEPLQMLYDSAPPGPQRNKIKATQKPKAVGGTRDMPVQPTNSRTGKPNWYLAELVLKIVVEGDDRRIIHKNLMLIRADTATEAYEKAVEIGNEHSMSYLNPQGKQVHIEFVGLSKLTTVYDRLEHGAELLYEECVGMSDEQIQSLAVPKHRLSVFSEPTSLVSDPDYSSADVLDEASRLIRQRV